MLGAGLNHITALPFHQACEQFCETESTFPYSQQRGERKAARLKLFQSPLAGQGPVSFPSLGLCSHPVDWGRQHLGLPKQSLWKRGFGSAGGGATGAEPCLHPDQNALKTQGREKHGEAHHWLPSAGLEEAREKASKPGARLRGQNGTSGRANHSRRNGPSPEGPLTSTRRPILAMCGEQSLTVSSFSICKRQKHSSKSDRARCSLRMPAPLPSLQRACYSCRQLPETPQEMRALFPRRGTPAQVINSPASRSPGSRFPGAHLVLQPLVWQTPHQASSREGRGECPHQAPTLPGPAREEALGVSSHHRSGQAQAQGVCPQVGASNLPGSCCASTVPVTPATEGGTDSPE